MRIVRINREARATVIKSPRYNPQSIFYEVQSISFVSEFQFLDAVESSLLI